MNNTVMQEWAKWIEQEFKPDIYIVATLKQGAGTTAHGYKTFVQGDEYRYEAAYNQFIKRLSKRVFGPTNYRRYDNIIKNIATLEGDGDTTRYHLNILLKRPDYITFDRLEMYIRREWLSIDWAMPDILIERRTGNAPLYSLKEGCDRIFIASRK